MVPAKKPGLVLAIGMGKPKAGDPDADSEGAEKDDESSESAAREAFDAFDKETDPKRRFDLFKEAVLTCVDEDKGGDY